MGTDDCHTTEVGGIPPLDQAMNDPVWDDEAWEALAQAEEVAKAALLDLYDSSYEGYGCSCDTCVVRVVLEAVWPTLTQQVNRAMERATALAAPVQTCKSSRCCGDRCKAED